MTAHIPDRLYILELANNHMGDVDHGVRVIRECATVCKKFPFRFAFKLQYRHLDTFIHPDYKGRDDIKYVKRFSETRLTVNEMQRLIDEIRANDFVAVCTPFDELSVELAVEQGVDILKIASCSLTDWPLVEKLATSNKPIIGSTAGLPLEDIDKVVAFMDHRSIEFALMHCVAEYPTQSNNLRLNQIDLLQERYPGVRIGYSTHEDPSETRPIGIAIGKGCTIFEKHVGLATDGYPLNAYSASPKQVEDWLTAADFAYVAGGQSGVRTEPSAAELSSLKALRRGVFVTRDIMRDETLQPGDIFMAIPVLDDQVTANDWSKYHSYVASAPILANAPVLRSNTITLAARDRVYTIVKRVKAALHNAHVVVPGPSHLEISHHYGLEQFDQYGITMITVINREYCKKLIVVLPGQRHPTQYHKQKEETFHILSGSLTVTLGSETRDYAAGSVVVVERGVHHSFESRTGAVVEEISSTHIASDSFYIDPTITNNTQRKTLLTDWLG
jgi:sialic acid synthase SpsE/mannose-6-phosphate isomerase-like protein (cupin superfamily)